MNDEAGPGVKQIEAAPDHIDSSPNFGATRHNEKMNEYSKSSPGGDLVENFAATKTTMKEPTRPTKATMGHADPEAPPATTKAIRPGRMFNPASDSPEAYIRGKYPLWDCHQRQPRCSSCNKGKKITKGQAAHQAPPEPWK